MEAANKSRISRNVRQNSGGERSLKRFRPV